MARFREGYPLIVNDPQQAQVVIVGGGIAGASAAYHLGKMGIGDVILLEQNLIGGGTTWHAAGMVTRMRTTAAMAAIHRHSASLYASLEVETGMATGWKEVGSLFLARTPDRVIQNRRAAAMARLHGVDSQEISPAAVQQIWPMMRVDDLAGALFIPDDGRTEPASTARALAEGARRSGVQIREGVEVTSLLHKGHRITGVRTNEGDILAETVLLCGGMWTRQLALDLGIAIPAYPVEHHYVVTNPVPGVTDWLPCTRDHDGSLYVRSEGEQLVLGAFQPHAKPWHIDRVPADFSFDLFEPDWASFSTAIREANHRFPGFDDIGYDRFVNGPESFTPDSHTIVGPVVGRDGLFVCAGYNSFGIAGAGGMGKVIAEWIVGGEEPMDLWEVDSRRFGAWQNELPYLTERMGEVLGHHYASAYPTTEFHSARDQRLSPVHARYAAAGAIFGERAGWERPVVIDPAAPDRHEPVGSWGRAPWFGSWQAEHLAARQAVALFDQSSFARLSVTGPDALALLNHAAANQIDVDPDTIVYTPFLNQRGRYVSDVTILREADDRFLVMTAAVQAVHDADWLDRLARKHEWQVAITDITTAHAVLGLMGPRSGTVLEALIGPVADALTVHGAVGTATIAGHPVRLARLSYVGESGWEVHSAAADALPVIDAILAVGEPHGLRLAGTMAMNSLRIEKGFVSWGHDVSRDDSPLQAGLGFTVAWDKPGGYLGRDALLRQRERGPDRRLLRFQLDDPEVLLWGHEPILRDGLAVGFTSSATYGHAVGVSVGMGYVQGPAPITREWIDTGTYAIEVAGDHHSASIRARANA